MNNGGWLIFVIGSGSTNELSLSSEGFKKDIVVLDGIESVFEVKVDDTFSIVLNKVYFIFSDEERLVSEGLIVG